MVPVGGLEERAAQVSILVTTGVMEEEVQVFHMVAADEAVEVDRVRAVVQAARVLLVAEVVWPAMARPAWSS